MSARGRPAHGIRNRTAKHVTVSVPPPQGVKQATSSTRKVVGVSARKRAAPAVRCLTPDHVSVSVGGSLAPVDRYSTPRPASASADPLHDVAAPGSSIPKPVAVTASLKDALQIVTLTQTDASVSAGRRTAQVAKSSTQKPANASVGPHQDVNQTNLSTKTHANVNAKGGNARPTKCLTLDHVSVSVRKGHVLGLRFSIPRPANASVGPHQDVTQTKFLTKTRANVNAKGGNARPTKCLTLDLVSASVRENCVPKTRDSTIAHVNVNVQELSVVTSYRSLTKTPVGVSARENPAPAIRDSTPVPASASAPRSQDAHATKTSTATLVDVNVKKGSVPVTRLLIQRHANAHVDQGSPALITRESIPKHANVSVSTGHSVTNINTSTPRLVNVSVKTDGAPRTKSLTHKHVSVSVLTGHNVANTKSSIPRPVAVNVKTGHAHQTGPLT